MKQQSVVATVPFVPSLDWELMSFSLSRLLPLDDYFIGYGSCVKCGTLLLAGSHGFPSCGVCRAVDREARLLRKAYHNSRFGRSILRKEEDE